MEQPGRIDQVDAPPGMSKILEGIAVKDKILGQLGLRLPMGGTAVTTGTVGQAQTQMPVNEIVAQPTSKAIEHTSRTSVSNSAASPLKLHCQ